VPIVSHRFSRTAIVAASVAAAVFASSFPLQAQNAAAVSPSQPATGVLKTPPTADSLDQIAYRGYLLWQYDYVAWAASDSVSLRHPPAGVAPRMVARQRGEKRDRWNVGFGRLSANRDTFYVAYEVRQQQSDPNSFDVVELTPARADVGYYAHAARAIAIAKDDYGALSRPYNSAVIERPNGMLWVYLMPTQTEPGVYPLGGDVRYLFAADGRQIVAKRQLHKTVIEYAGQQASADKIQAGTHTAVLDDIPEDTDVFHVLTRQPRVPEYVMTDAFLYAISTKGDIRIVSQRPVTPSAARASDGATH
jgi:hypothetical protein